MLRIDEKDFATIADVAKALGGVSPKTVRAWIEKDIIPQPPTITQGLRTIRYFPSEYIEIAKRRLESYRQSKIKS